MAPIEGKFESFNSNKPDNQFRLEPRQEQRVDLGEKTEAVVLAETPEAEARVFIVDKAPGDLIAVRVGEIAKENLISKRHNEFVVSDDKPVSVKGPFGQLVLRKV